MILRKADIQRAAAQPVLWTDVPGYGGKYAANERGFILNRESGRVVSNTTYANGYVYVSMTTDEGSKNKRLHRLIAETFLPNHEAKPQVNHISGVKLNNHIANLEWATSSENLKHAFSTGLMSVKRPWLGKQNNTPRCREVQQLTPAGELVRIWPSVAEAGRNGFTAANIAAVCNGRRPTHKGFNWKY